MINDFHYTNSSPSRARWSSRPPAFPGQRCRPFDLRVEMPLPPAEISVRADRGLVTTEAGGQATFRVALDSPGDRGGRDSGHQQRSRGGHRQPGGAALLARDWDRPRP